MQHDQCLEDHAMLGGSVGLAPHVTIGKGARVAARSGVMNDIPPQQTWSGYPARPKMQWMRLQAVLARLAAPGDKAAAASTLREES
jgi:UDP-3-O-[3-hydroxymyristoyl] glucosamine N-acyltransferase